jgi:hypothetical protein
MVSAQIRQPAGCEKETTSTIIGWIDIVVVNAPAIDLIH